MQQKKKHNLKRFFACGKSWYKKWWIWVLALVIIIAIPFIINESYKRGGGYTTMWDAADMLSFYGSFLAFLGTVALGVLALWQNKKANEINDMIMEMTRREKMAYFYPHGLNSISDCQSVIKFINKGNSFGTITNYKITRGDDTSPYKIGAVNYFVDNNETRDFDIKIPEDYFNNSGFTINFVFEWVNSFGFRYVQIIDLTYKRYKEPILNTYTFLLDSTNTIFDEHKEDTNDNA